MDSPANITLSTTTVGASTLASKQPTYTTAGTIYDPNSSQPLQPPTRRGRSFKWTQGPPGELLPKSVLASLALKSGSGRKPVVPQYSPLQQNYDRAVSPPFEADQQQEDMPHGIHLLQEEPVVGFGLVNGGPDDDEHEESDSDSTDFGADPLLGMTVKSLHNLASYPNPNQKRAQKALLRGTKPSLNGFGGSNRSNTPSRPLGIRPIGSPPKEKTSIIESRVGLQATVVSKKETRFSAQHESTPTLEDEDVCNILRMPSPILKSVHSETHSTTATLAEGPGAPRPLTAGPPGHRQYRPSTFESTWKALQAKAQLHESGLRSSDDNRDEIGSLSEHQEPCWPPTPAPRSWAETVYGINMANDSGSDKFSAYAFSRDMDGSVPDMTKKGKKKADNSAPPEKLILPSWRDDDLETRMRFKPGTDRLTEEAIRLKNEKINRSWYSGADLLGKTASEAAIDMKVRLLEHNVGAIGDGRPVKEHTRYASIKIEEANRMSRAEHSEPILNMAFGTLIRYVEGDGYQTVQ